MNRVFQTTAELRAWIDEVAPPTRAPRAPHAFDMGEWDEQRERRVVEAQEDRLDAASALLERAARIAEAAERMEGESHPLAMAFQVEVARLRAEARALKGDAA